MIIMTVIEKISSEYKMNLAESEKSKKINPTLDVQKNDLIQQMNQLKNSKHYQNNVLYLNLENQYSQLQKINSQEKDELMNAQNKIMNFVDGTKKIIDGKIFSSSPNILRNSYVSSICFL